MLQNPSFLYLFIKLKLITFRLKQVVQKFYEYLKPGGMILFRDYGRFDMAQLRFKKGRCISENYYSRGDGTLVNFFTQGKVKFMK